MVKPTPKQVKRYNPPTKKRTNKFPLKGILNAKIHKKTLKIKDNMPSVKYGTYFPITKFNFVIFVENNCSSVPLSHSLEITKAVSNIPIKFIVTAKDPGRIKYDL